jgi:hypothetical protein
MSTLSTDTLPSLVLSAYAREALARLEAIDERAVEVAAEARDVVEPERRASAPPPAS